MYVYLYSIDKEGQRRLRKDWRLRRYADTVPFVHVGVDRYNTTWTSATEYAVLWRLEHMPQTAPAQPATDRADAIRAIWSQEHAEA